MDFKQNSTVNRKLMYYFEEWSDIDTSAQMYNRMSDTPGEETGQNYQTNCSTPAAVANPALQSNPTLQPMANPGQPTIFIQAAGVRRYQLTTRIFVGLGITQIVLGALCIIMQVVAIVVETIAHKVGSGFWCSIFFIVAGGFGIAAGKNKTLCPTVTCMVMSIISATSTAILFSLNVVSAAIHQEYNSYSYYHYHQSQDYGLSIGVAVTLSILAVIEAVVAIVSASLCCKAVCCGRNGSEPMVAYIPSQPGQLMGPMVIVQNPVVGGSVPMGVAGARAPQQDFQADELPPKTPPPGYEENPHFQH